MRLIAAALLLILSVASSGQQVRTETENTLRKEDAINDLIRYAKNIPVKNTLCKPNEYAIFSFITTNNKTVTCCIARHASASSGYIVYRFGTKQKIEFEFPADTVNSFSQFTYSGYHRGGGIQNACMDIDVLRFENNGYRYEIQNTYTCEENKKETGIIIYRPGVDKPIEIKARGKLTGSIYQLKDVVNVSDEL